MDAYGVVDNCNPDERGHGEPPRRFVRCAGQRKRQPHDSYQRNQNQKRLAESDVIGEWLAQNSHTRLLSLLRKLLLELAGLIDGFAGGKVFKFEELADFDFSVSAILRIRAALCPVDGFLSRFDINHPIAG